MKTPKSLTINQKKVLKLMSDGYVLQMSGGGLHPLANADFWLQKRGQGRVGISSDTLSILVQQNLIVDKHGWLVLSEKGKAMSKT